MAYTITLTKDELRAMLDDAAGKSSSPKASDQFSHEPTQDALETKEEIAARLKINPRTVLRMAADGEIPVAVDRPNMKRFEWSAVKAALAPQAKR